MTKIVSQPRMFMKFLIGDIFDIVTSISFIQKCDKLKFLTLTDLRLWLHHTRLQHEPDHEISWNHPPMQVILVK